MDKPRVVYLSAPPHGEAMLEFLWSLPCEVVGWTCIDAPMPWQETYSYDLGLNFLGTHKIPAEEVARPSLGWVNFHPAPLPEYRGRNLCYYAITGGAKFFGATAHYMDTGFDTGPIIEVKRFPITPNLNAGDLHGWAIAACIQLFKEWIPKLLQGRVPATPQDPAQGWYYSKKPIIDEVRITQQQEEMIRARTYHPRHHARVNVGGRWYRIVPEDV